MSTGALYRNDAGEFLIVKPHYKDSWDLPGGVIELDEAPFAGCIREIREELSLDLGRCRPLCVDAIENDATYYSENQRLVEEDRYS